MELDDLKNVKPWMWVGLAALALLFCCCGIIVVLAILGPMVNYYFGGAGG
jgi:hypothetical protein